MKLPFDARPPSGAAIHSTIQRALAAAGLDMSSGPLRTVGDTLRRALGPPEIPVPGTLAPDALQPAPDAPGRFDTHRFANAAGARDYKLYIPAQGAGTARPVVVMLHGCTQSADDFAAGTQMNRLADRDGFLVVYPEQSPQANASKCWNWFQPQDQTRDAGEPALIAGIVREVLARHGGDPQRVFVAGLSAGGAMAVVLGQTHPELFAGIGVHSGLPYGSAHDVPSALAAMKGGRSGLPGLQRAAGAGGASKTAAHAVPTIVFHGDRDHTVQQSNGAEIVRQALDAHAARSVGGAPRPRTDTGSAAGGRDYTRTVHVDAAGRVAAEEWTLHGAGHAWSGGDAGGSYTDGAGPDASVEMLRFFLALPRAGSA